MPQYFLFPDIHNKLSPSILFDIKDPYTATQKDSGYLISSIDHITLWTEEP
jgi:hypothetical protein